jgi:molybdopterin-guanine dinucleotide biosynthesis protein
MSTYRVIVSFVAPEHSGKTTLEAVIAKILGQHGITVHMPPDPQRDDKLAMPLEKLLDSFREKGTSVLFIESDSA